MATPWQVLAACQARLTVDRTVAICEAISVRTRTTCFQNSFIPFSLTNFQQCNFECVSLFVCDCFSFSPADGCHINKLVLYCIVLYCKYHQAADCPTDDTQAGRHVSELSRQTAHHPCLCTAWRATGHAILSVLWPKVFWWFSATLSSELPKKAIRYSYLADMACYQAALGIAIIILISLSTKYSTQITSHQVVHVKPT